MIYRTLFLLPIIGTFLFLSLFGKCSGSQVGSAQYNVTHYDHTKRLKCYSCVSIERYPNISAEGCSKRRPPAHYLTQDCYGFNSPTALAAIRHVSGSDKFGRSPDPFNIHCVHIKGMSDVGGEITVRGCLALPTGEEWQTKTCMREKDFPFIPFGFVREVEYCYCKNADGCNGASRNVKTGLSTVAIIMGVAAFYSMTSV